MPASIVKVGLYDVLKRPGAPNMNSCPNGFKLHFVYIFRASFIGHIFNRVFQSGYSIILIHGALVNSSFDRLRSGKVGFL